MKYFKETHKNFRLNGKKFDSESSLFTFAKSISEEVFLFLNDWLSDAEKISVKTSGSTGNPKVIDIKKVHMINSAKATGRFLNLKENTRALLCLSPEFIAGKMMLVRALILGWHLDITTTSSHPLDGNPYNYDFCAMVPLQVQKSLSKLNQIKILIIGGASINVELQRELQKLKTKVFATYGMTETITHIALKRLNGTIESSYKVLPNILIKKDKRDCLVIEAPDISDNVIITNDLVKIIDKTHFKWLGRFDNVINSGGLKLNPEIIEDKLAKILPFNFFITGFPDKILGQKVVLIGEGTPQNLDKYKLEQQLSKFERPKSIFFVNQFILTSNGKLNRKKTLKLLESH